MPCGTKTELKPGTAAARWARLVEQHTDLVEAVARTFDVPADIRDDLVQVGLLALRRAEVGHQTGRGFRAFAQTAVRRAMAEALPSLRGPLPVPRETLRRHQRGLNRSGPSQAVLFALSLQPADDALAVLDALRGREADASVGIERQEEASRFNAAWNSLGRLSREVLARHYGLEGQPPVTLKSLDREYDLSPGGSGRLMKLALQQLRDSLKEKDE